MSNTQLPAVRKPSQARRAGVPPIREQRVHKGSGRENHVAALRRALRGTTQGESERQDKRAVEKAAAPLITSFFNPLMRFCGKLAHGAPHAALEAEDLAILAWEKVLRYLAGACGDHVSDEEHFWRLLLVAARSCLLSVLDQRPRGHAIELDKPLGGDQAAMTRGDLVPDTRATAEELLLLGDSPYLKLVEKLFREEESFHEDHRQKNQRHPRNYQALVLYQIGAHWREEVGEAKIEDPRLAALIRHYVALLGVPADLWAQVEEAAITREPEQRNRYSPGLLAAVNKVCGTNLKGNSTLAVLRHEMNKFAVTG